jgi:hypoxanthine phosphoribosyltransferase
MPRDIARIIIDKDRIAARVGELGEQLARDLRRSLEADARAGGPAADDPSRVIFIPILTGSIVFVADLIRRMPIMLSLRVVTVSSYPGQSTKSKGAKIAGELPTDLAGKHVVVVDDILDSGQTLALIRDTILKLKPASLRICVLLKKPESVRKAKVDAAYVGFKIPEAFVVGYGLDFDGYYRNLPYIAELGDDLDTASGAEALAAPTRARRSTKDSKAPKTAPSRSKAAKRVAPARKART